MSRPVRPRSGIGNEGTEAAKAPAGAAPSEDWMGEARREERPRRAQGKHGKHSAPRRRRWRREEPEYVELPPESGPVRKLAIAVVVVVLLVGLVVVGGRTWYQNQVDPSGDPGAAITVEIPEGTSVSGAGGLLADRGVISNGTVFRFWVRDKDVPTIQAGLYRFRRDSSFEEALAVLTDGPVPPPIVAVTVPEGLTVRQLTDQLVETLPQLNRDDMEAALQDPEITSAYRPEGVTSLEGLLFPATYEVDRDADARSIIQQMAAQMEVVGARIDLETRAALSNLTPYETLTVASLIEEETGNPDESPMIARVIYNRLQQGIPLGIDATSLYEAEQEGTELDFESESPYNTRRQVGLPPTPISAPSEASIEAALAPAEGTWIYYVLETPDRHFFTDSAAEFEAAKDRCAERDLGCG